jgi:hypothetical protein
MASAIPDVSFSRMASPTKSQRCGIACGKAEELVAEQLVRRTADWFGAGP